MSSAYSDLTARSLQALRTFKRPQVVVAETIDPLELQPIELAKNNAFVVLPGGARTAPVLYVGDPRVLDAVGPVVNRGVLQAIVDEAVSHVGYREGKRNKNQFSAYYGRSAEMWCADFASFVFEKAGHAIGDDERGFASVRLMAEWFASKGHLYQGTPQPGEAIFFNNSRKGRWNHVGIVEKVENGIVYTIEGNVGGRKGGVGRRAYALTNKNILGYGRPPLA